MAQLSFSYQKCFAYDNLWQQIGKQCDIYQRLHKTGDLGSMPDMYKESEYGIKIPTEGTSAFFRGGVITTMACFEVFVGKLYNEAADTIRYERSDCDATCEKCLQLQYKHVVKRSQERGKKEKNGFKKWNHTPSSPVLHKWEYIYAKSLCGRRETSFMTELFQDGPMNYFYLLGKGKFSKIEIKDEVPVCALLRLFYGIRCIMAHGNAEETFKNSATLKRFEHCKKCACHNNEPSVHSILQHDCTDESAIKKCRNCQNPSTLSKLENISKLSSYTDQCIKQQDKTEVLKTNRFYPRMEPFKKLRNPKHKAHAERIVNTLFSDIDDIDSKEELDESYAFYHLCRIYSFLKNSKEKMYITYGLLVRINQFILVLAHRMRFAVANILMKRYKLPDGIWGVPKNKADRKTEIKKFEKEHRNKVKNLKSSKKNT